MNLYSVFVFSLQISVTFAGLHTSGTVDTGHPPWADTVYGKKGMWRYNSFRDSQSVQMGAGYWYSRQNFIQTINDGFRLYLHLQDLHLKPPSQRTKQEIQFMAENNYAKLIPVKNRASLQYLANKWNTQFDANIENELLSKKLGLLHIPFDMQPGSITEINSLLKNGIVHEFIPQATLDAFGYTNSHSKYWNGFPDSAHRAIVLISTPGMTTDPYTHHQQPDCRIHSIHSIVTHPTRRQPNDPQYVPDPQIPAHELPPLPTIRGRNVYAFSAKKKNGVQLMGPVIKTPHKVEPHLPPRDPHHIPGPKKPSHPKPSHPTYREILEAKFKFKRDIEAVEKQIRDHAGSILAKMAGYTDFDAFLKYFFTID